MTQIINITSQALQASIRRLLPSQQGFGEDLQATNLITPVIDLTPTAEGSSVPQYLQTAVSFDSATAFGANNSTEALTSSGGFYRVIGTATIVGSSGSNQITSFDMVEGGVTKSVWKMEIPASSGNPVISENVDLTFFVDSPTVLNAVATSQAFVVGSIRQVATLTGELINPQPFEPQ